MEHASNLDSLPLYSSSLPTAQSGFIDAIFNRIPDAGETFQLRGIEPKEVGVFSRFNREGIFDIHHVLTVKHANVRTNTIWWASKIRHPALVNECSVKNISYRRKKRSTMGALIRVHFIELDDFLPNSFLDTMNESSNEINKNRNNYPLLYSKLIYSFI